MIFQIIGPMTIAFQIIFNLRYEDQAKPLKKIYKVLLSLAAIACFAFASVSSFYMFNRLVDLVNINDIVKQPIEDVYDLTKTGNQLIFNRKIENDSFIKDTTSTITNETKTYYTIVRYNHVHQIPKSIVTEK